MKDIARADIKPAFPVRNVPVALAAQTLRNIEVICVDDGSTDGSGAICERFAAADTRFKILHQTRFLTERDEDRKKRDDLKTELKASKSLARVIQEKLVEVVKALMRAREQPDIGHYGLNCQYSPWS